MISRFVKGQSGNPNGRPKGSRNKATLFKNEIFDILRERKDEIWKMKIEDLVTVASKFVPKEREINISEESESEVQVLIVNKGES